LSSIVITLASKSKDMMIEEKIFKKRLLSTAFLPFIVFLISSPLSKYGGAIHHSFDIILLQIYRSFPFIYAD
jgi:hypothetical protein